MLVLLSENQPSCPPIGFVKSQEGENEEGSEGELVVKFGETLPKVIQEPDAPRVGTAVTQPAVLDSGRALARPDQREWASQGSNAKDTTAVLPTCRASCLPERFKAHFSAVVKGGPVLSVPNIPKLISVPVMDRGRHLEVFVKTA